MDEFFKILKKFNSIDMNELHRAVRNNAEAVEYLVKRGADITCTINQGQTPLHFAAQLGSFHMFDKLLHGLSRDEARNLIDQRTFDTNTTALHIAARRNSDTAVRFLLSRGANFEIRDNENRKPKHWTTNEDIIVLMNRIKEVFESTPARVSASLLEELNPSTGGNVAPVMYARDKQGFTSLQLALHENHLQAAAAIIHFRIERLTQNPWLAGAEIGELARHSKAARRRMSKLDALCDWNDEGNSFGTHWALSKSTVDPRVRAEVVALLREACEFLEAYKERRDPSLEDQPLLIILEESLEFFGSWEASKFTENKRVDSMLMGKGPLFATQMLKLCVVAPIQFFMQHVYTSELLEAAKRDDMAKVEKCLTGHPNMNARDADDLTVLHHALKNRNMNMFELLLKLGAEPTSASDKNGESLIHFLSRQDIELDSELLSTRTTDGLDVLKLPYDYVDEDGVDGRNHDESTALHLAAKANNYRLANFLLTCGATYRAKDADGKMPRDHCSERSNTLGLLKNIDKLFAEAREGKLEDLMTTMREFDDHFKLALGNARDDEGRTLHQVLKLKGHVEEAKQIRELLRVAVW